MVTAKHFARSKWGIGMAAIIAAVVIATVLGAQARNEAQRVDEASDRRFGALQGRDGDMSGRDVGWVSGRKQSSTESRFLEKYESLSAESSAGSSAPVASGENAVVGATSSLGGKASDAAQGGGSTLSIEQHVVRSGMMSLRVTKGKLQGAALRIENIASSFGGYVSNSNTAMDSSSNFRTGAVTIRIPAAKYQQAMRKLQSVGTVTSQSSSSQDVSEEYVDVASRVKHNTAVAERLLTLLAKAETVSETLAVQNRLDAVQEKIEVDAGRMNFLTKQVNLATITVEITEKGSSPAAEEVGFTWGIGDAVTTAASDFMSSVNRAIVWFGGALPVLLVLAAVGLGIRRVARRSSQADTDGETETRESDR